MTDRETGIYAEYGLESAEFDIQIFDQDWGGKLCQSGHGDVAEEMLAAGTNRNFLREAMSGITIRTVNGTETIKSARQAEEFRDRVATVDIQENFEPLIDLRKPTHVNSGNGWVFTNAKYHSACGQWAGHDKLFVVRETVAERLFLLASYLGSVGLKIRFEDGFRPLGVQEGLFRRRIDMARLANPEWSDEELLLEARSKTAFTPRFAAHKAGAAVDLRLFSSSNGELLDIGHDYPEGGDIVRLDTPFVTQTQWQNRKILDFMARKSGLSMYPFEDWHLCHGDTTAAIVESMSRPYVAKYGPIKEYDSESGEILSIYLPDELDSVFDMKKDK